MTKEEVRRDFVELFGSCLITKRDLCKYLRVSERTINRMIEKAEIEFIKTDSGKRGLVRFAPEAVARYCNSKKIIAA